MRREGRGAQKKETSQSLLWAFTDSKIAVSCNNRAPLWG